MNTEKLANILNARILNDGGAEINCGYAGDFLSFVIGKAPSNSAWLTVMNNVNVCAVATLAEIGAVVLCESVEPDAKLLEKAEEQGVALLVSPLDVFSASAALSKALEEEHAGAGERENSNADEKENAGADEYDSRGGRRV
jgi:predicted transcriptional regulator